MRKLLVFQHVPHEPLGTLDAQFRDAGFRIRYVNFARSAEACPDVRRYHGVVVLGGPMNVDQTDRYPHLATEKEAIGEAIDCGIPVLGICLGAQLIAVALGGSVSPNPVKEIGWYDVSPTDAGRDDPLFAHFRRTERVFQWHGDTFSMPSGAVHLAEAAACANQAFRYGDSVYGLQFHLEVDEALILRWLRTSVNVKELSGLRGTIDPDQIRAETPRHIHRLGALSRSVFGEFIERFYSWRRKTALPSR